MGETQESRTDARLRACRIGAVATKGQTARVAKYIGFTWLLLAFIGFFGSSTLAFFDRRVGFPWLFLSQTLAFLGFSATRVASSRPAGPRDRPERGNQYLRTEFCSFYVLIARSRLYPLDVRTMLGPKSAAWVGLRPGLALSFGERLAVRRRGDK